MFKMKLVAAAVVTLVLTGGTSYTARLADGPAVKPAVLLGIDRVLCRTAAGGPAAHNKLFFKIAAASPELKPYGQLPAREKLAPHAVDVRTDNPPLWTNLGPVSQRITTAQPLAQEYFNQGLRLTFAFNHGEAARSYRMAQRLDPSCAMCHWGEALVLGPHINAAMEADAAAPALAAVNKAQALMKRATPREQALIRALATRYSSDPKADRAALDAAYADAMAKVAALYPRDQNIAVLYAESLMDLTPWDYWEVGGARPKGRTPEIVATLERVLKVNPNHPGAIHYYIHMVEASANPQRAEPYAERLAQIVPGAGHLVHMPAHIYYRLGRFKDSLTANRQAVAVDEAYIAAEKPTGMYPNGYYLHNVHFLLASAQMAGDGATVIEAANKLAAILTDDAARTFPMAQLVKVGPYFAHAQFSAPDTILAIPAPSAGLPYVEGLWHYARGVAHVEKGEPARARREIAAIERLRQTGDFKNLTAAGIPATAVLQLAGHVLQARIAQAAGDYNNAVAQFEKATQLEEGLAYMEPPFWYYPVRQSLGAALLQKGDLGGAEQAFRASLVRAPNNGWALYGLSEVYRQRGDDVRVAATEQLLADAWAGKREELNLKRL